MTHPSSSSRSTLRRRLPAEWEPQAGIQLTWPHADSDWAPVLDAAEATFAEIVRQVTKWEPVLLAASDRQHSRSVLRDAGVDLSSVHTYEIPSDDTWARDHGPITVYEDGAPLLLDFTFNGWGGKFTADRDNRVTRALHEAGAFGTTPIRSLDVVLEGGSIDSDGAGTLLTTSQCLLTPTRNRELDQTRIEATLRDAFGADRILWLHHGYLAGDDTDSHVDTLARFCNKSTIAHVFCDDAQDEHFESLRAMENELQAFRTRDGAPYRLVRLPLPTPCYDDEGNRLPATYANFLILNGAVLVPAYNVPEDAIARSVLATCFADRVVIGVPCNTLIAQHGSLHCVTMQLPTGVEWCLKP